MFRLSASWSKKRKKVTAAILAAGALAGALLTLKNFAYQFIPTEPDEYNEDWIPLVYEEADEFREFLENNVGKKVKIDSAIALDDAIPINHLLHQICEFNGPDEADSGNAATPRSFAFGLPEFEAEFDESDLDAIAYNEEEGDYDIPRQVLSKVKCIDTIRIVPIEPANFRWSYGGTGTRSLPLLGTFRVTRRLYSGPSIEYTLRQLEE